MFRIDAHIHFTGDHPDALRLLDELDLKVLNICVASDDPAWHDWRRTQAAPYAKLAREHPARFAWCTTFDLPDERDDYAERQIASLARDFEHGAVACKVWKNLGMEVRARNGRYITIDDPMFAPIFDFLERVGKPLLMHIGEPLECWQPLQPGRPHYNYYRENPQWHMFEHPEVPDHAAQIAARDRVVERYPDLQVVGAHLGSLEYDVAEVAKRFERYPNFWVDTSARLLDLTHQDSTLVRDFFLRYADRILYGSDVVALGSQAARTPESRAHLYEMTRDLTQQAFAYFERDDIISIGDRSVQALALPDDVLQKIYVSNARACYPGL